MTTPFKLTATYGARAPGYSAPTFAVSIEAEVSGINDVPGEVRRLHDLLKTSVDEHIRPRDFLTGRPSGPAPNGSSKAPINGGPWACSDKQRELLLKLIEEHHLDKQAIDDFARKHFDVGIVELDKQQMSLLLDLLLEQHGGKGRRPPPQRHSDRPEGGAL